jgi:UDP-N-acetylmuramate--alanine ligase
VVAVVTNIDADHMETYEHSLDKLRQAFTDFLQHLPFYGVAVLCADDANVNAVVPRITKPVVTYGLNPDAHVRALDVAPHGAQMRFRAVLPKTRRSGGAELPITLNLPGVHNVRNALAAIAVGAELGVPEAAIVKALAEFKGVGRRFQNHGKIRLAGGGSFTLIDDYGHHPAEMAATLAAARGAFPKRRILLAFQPHRYTRTRDCFEDFVKVLSTADALALTEVYPAGEAPIVAADGKALARAIRVQGRVEPVFVEKIADLPAAILGLARDGDVVLTMGAGSIGNVPGLLVSRPRSVNDAA